MADARSPENRRAAYRVEPCDADEIDLEMLGRRQRIRPHRVADIAAGGACVHVDDVDATEIGVGQEVDVSVRSERHAFDGRIKARVVSSNNDEAPQVVHLTFLGDSFDISAPSGPMRELLNRRSSYRGIEVGEDDDFQALAAPRGAGAANFQSYPVAVRNVSNTGACLELDAATHAALEPYRDLNVTFDLPRIQGPTSIACQVRYRSAIVGGCVYGCIYDWSATADSLKVVEDLASYIVGVQSRRNDG